MPISAAALPRDTRKIPNEENGAVKPALNNHRNTGTAHKITSSNWP